METAIAWLNLSEADSLLIEIFEDFDVETTSGGTELTQVKHTASDRTLTLASKDARDALENFWATSREGEVPDVSLVIHTNMEIGREHGADLPGGVTGIAYWHAVNCGADTAPLKALLLNTLPGGKLKDWLESNPDEGALRSRLINRVSWRTSQPSGAAQNAMLAELIAGRLAALELPVGMAPSTAAAIVDRVFTVGSENDPALRRLTAADLHGFLHEVARPGQPGHETGWARASWTAPVEEIDLPDILATRTGLVQEFLGILDDTHALWLHGASGTGKSTLALQIAQASEVNWLAVDFRGPTNPSEMLRRLDRAYTDITLGGDVRGIILDDMDSDTVAKHTGRLGRFVNWMRERGGYVVVTSTRVLNPASFQAARFTPNAAKCAPYLSVDEITEFVGQTYAPLDQAEAWGLTIHIAASGGHPQLTAAKVVSLNHRRWPIDALIEDISGTPSEAIELSRAEARRRLLEDATDHGRALLKRLGCIMFKFDRPTAIAIAALAPSIEEPSASLDLLTGPWIEKVPTAPGYFRLSPLLSGLQEDLGPETIKSVQTGFLISTIKRGPIPYEALDSVFWTALGSKQGWFITKFFEKSLSFDNETHKAVAAKLSGLVYLRTDQMLLPEDPSTSHFLRMLQIDVAALNGEKTLFEPIALAAMREAMAVGNEELRNALTSMALLKILLAQGARLDWGLRLSYIAYFEALAKMEPDLVQSSQSSAVQLMQEEFGETADVSGFMLQIGASANENPAELKAFFLALERLEPDARTRRLSQLRTFFKGYSLHIQSAWANAWSTGKLDVASSIDDYETIASMAENWGETDLIAECTIAQSVLWDEFQNDRPKALEIVETGIEALPDHPGLLRQKAKVLGHDHQYEEARAILESIRAHTDQSSDIERMYALKEQAVASANLGDLGAARTAFLEAASAAEAVQSEVTSARAHKVALRAEAAMCLWRSGDVETALRELAPLINMLDDIDPESDDAARALHLKLRWLVGWLHETTGGPTGLERELHYGALAALDADYPEEKERPSGRLEDIKLLLIIVGLRQNLHDLFPDLSWSKTTLAFHILLGAAEFDLAVKEGTPDQIAHALLQLAAAFDVAQKERAGTPISQIEKIKQLHFRDLEDPGVKAVFVHSSALAAYFGARDRADKTTFCEALLVELQKRLKATTPELDLWREILVGTSTADSADYATQIFSYALAPDDEVLHPSNIINRQLSLLQCAAACGCGARMIKQLHILFADEWAFIVEHQRFLLSQPSLHVPALEAAINWARKEEVGALANLLQSGARALGSRLPKDWLDLAEKLGGRARD
ncbi:hypothetical protein [Thalassorhabdomicrobium marinisediminis]|uniref:hypothetical protein n=1 Tax=Thalassorhabdomicrobium marinisediminis TaxID=2170577 RepID=UPI0011B23B48|nr:hypothetical protein [Thalassorhabdomicrobium marinisediminis]